MNMKTRLYLLKRNCPLEQAFEPSGTLRENLPCTLALYKQRLNVYVRERNGNTAPSLALKHSHFPSVGMMVI